MVQTKLVPIKGYCIYGHFLIPIGFRLFANAEFIFIVNNRGKSAKWERGFTQDASYVDNLSPTSALSQVSLLTPIGTPP